MLLILTRNLQAHFENLNQMVIPGTIQKMSSKNKYWEYFQIHLCYDHGIELEQNYKLLYRKSDLCFGRFGKYYCHHVFNSVI